MDQRNPNQYGKLITNTHILQLSLINIGPYDNQPGGNINSYDQSFQHPYTSQHQDSNWGNQTGMMQGGQTAGASIH